MKKHITYAALVRDAKKVFGKNGPELLDFVLDPYKDLEKRCLAVSQEYYDLEKTFALRWKADMRAIKRWQKATGKTQVWPDHVDLVCWLIEQLDAKEKK